jgi:hypothetical protein
MGARGQTTLQFTSRLDLFSSEPHLQGEARALEVPRHPQELRSRRTEICERRSRADVVRPTGDACREEGRPLS